jgi:hypothetical protein
MNVRTAMLSNLKNPPEPWADVIRTHFKLKSRSILQQLDKWLAEDDGRTLQSDGGVYANVDRVGAITGRSNNGFKQDIDEMKSLLKKLQKDKSIDE